MNNQLITLEQLPIIKYHLEQLSIEIKEKVDRANSLYVGEQTVKDVKKVRADLNKEFNELETQRKAVKQAIMSKYEEFEEIYKENVSNLYKQADSTLKEKIDKVENQLKLDRENELKEFANQYLESYNVKGFIEYEDIPINVTLSASMKSLKEQILAFIEKVDSDLKLIGMEEYKEEILIEYNRTLDFVDEKTKVIERHKQIEDLKQQQENIQNKIQEEEKVVEKVEEITAPKEIIEDEEIITVQFTITDTKSKIIKLRDYLKENGINYE